MVSQSRVRSVRRSEAGRAAFAGWNRLRSLWSEFVRWQSAAISGLLIAGVILLTLADTDRMDRELGERVDAPIVARAEFRVRNDRSTDQLVQAARLATPNYFRLNPDLLSRIEGELRDLLGAAQAAASFDAFQKTAAERWSIDERSFEAVTAFKGDEGARRFEQLVAAIQQAVRDSRMIEAPTAKQRGANEADHDILTSPGGEQRVLRSRLWYVTNPEHVALVSDQAARIQSVPATLRPLVRDLLTRAISGSGAKPPQPLAPFVFDADRTRAEIARAEKVPPVFDTYARGSILVEPGAISEDRLALLRAEHEQFLKVRDSDPLLRARWMRERAGRAVLAVLVLLGFMIYVGAFQPRVVEMHTRGLALATLVLSVLAGVRLIDVLGAPTLWSISLIVVAASVLTLAYRPRFALGAAGVIALLSTLIIQETLGLWLVQVASAAVAAMMLPYVRTRLRFVQVAVAAGAIAALVTSAVCLTELEHWSQIGRQSAMATLAAIMGVLFILVILPVVERTFRVATPLTLLEWADFGRPLLKQLIQRAPGTWHHSNLLATMCEAAADEIGANGLLARVGALYHDIGKVSKPEYFVENQQPAANAHSRLAPRMSMLVILGHVKDGLALAREYGLPKVLTRFIAEHHGTTVVRYFHHRAAQQHAARGGAVDDPEIDETEFRYPGPKPQSRETAILMLCDGVEGAVRILQDPNPGRIEGVVHEIAMSRLMDGQFDDCDITLKELQRVEQSLVKSLCAIYHGRIAYPQATPPEPRMVAAQSA